MIKIVDIVYYCHTEYQSTACLLEKHRPTLGFTDYIKDRVDYTVVRHLDYEGNKTIDGIRYAFFRRPNTAWQIPLKTHRYIKSIDPDIVFVHGFIFPLQVIALKILLGKKCRIVLQHHAEEPVNSMRKIFQTVADRFISAYLFSAYEIAQPWLDHRVIRNADKVRVLMGASVTVQDRDKIYCKKQLGLTGNRNFLWVGRLNQNKDPLTVLRAFVQHLKQYPDARLYMIYQTNELLEQVQALLNEQRLHKHVILLGKLPHEELANWFHAADYFISASHAEAAGYALLEAMSAGCIPVVSRIPSYQNILEKSPGYLFRHGNADELAQLLNSLPDPDSSQQSSEVKAYFLQHLSFEKVAGNMFSLFNQLYSEKR
jgi:glycosyltransferase involved in cell wall biosynthesis